MAACFWGQRGLPAAVLCGAAHAAVYNRLDCMQLGCARGFLFLGKGPACVCMCPMVQILACLSVVVRGMCLQPLARLFVLVQGALRFALCFGYAPLLYDHRVCAAVSMVPQHRSFPVSLLLELPLPQRWVQALVQCVCWFVPGSEGCAHAGMHRAGIHIP